MDGPGWIRADRSAFALKNVTLVTATLVIPFSLDHGKVRSGVPLVTTKFMGGWIDT